MDYKIVPPKNLPLPPHKYQPPCQPHPEIELDKTTPGRTPMYYNAFPRDCKFAYMTPGYYATGFRILDIYKTEVDFTEMRSLLFLEDPKQVKKWGVLKKRIPFPETRVTDLPGTRELHYNNYCLRSLTPESAASWRKSIFVEKTGRISKCAEKVESKEKCECEDTTTDKEN